MRSDEPSPLSASERELLDGVLAHDFKGVEALRMQAQTVQAKRGCGCGCGTIDLLPQGKHLRRSKTPSPVPVEGVVLDDHGQAVGGLLLFLKDGILDSLEVYSYDEPLPLPPVDRVRWEFVPR